MWGGEAPTGAIAAVGHPNPTRILTPSSPQTPPQPRRVTASDIRRALRKGSSALAFDAVPAHVMGIGGAHGRRHYVRRGAPRHASPRLVRHGGELGSRRRCFCPPHRVALAACGVRRVAFDVWRVAPLTPPQVLPEQRRHPHLFVINLDHAGTLFERPRASRVRGF